MRFSLSSLLLPIGFGLSCAAAPAHAQSRPNSGELELAVSIVDGCTLSTTDVVFGLIIGTSGAIRSVGAVDVQCTADLDFTISMDRGLHSLGANRRMYNPANSAYIRYALYSDAGYSRPWTDRNAGKVRGNSGATGRITYPVYGEMTFDGMPVSGTYEDQVTVTIEF